MFLGMDSFGRLSVFQAERAISMRQPRPESALHRRGSSCVEGCEHAPRDTCRYTAGAKRNASLSRGISRKTEHAPHFRRAGHAGFDGGHPCAQRSIRPHSSAIASMRRRVGAGENRGGQRRLVERDQLGQDGAADVASARTVSATDGDARVSDVEPQQLIGARGRPGTYRVFGPGAGRRRPARRCARRTARCPCRAIDRAIRRRCRRGTR